MLSLRRVTPLCWFISGSSDILVTGHIENADKYTLPAQLHVCAAFVSTDTEDFATVVVDHEVWSSSLFTTNPMSAVSDIVQDLRACYDLQHPIEMIYRWGGQLHHLDVAVVVGETKQ